jgi:hypothetical protein
MSGATQRKRSNERRFPLAGDPSSFTGFGRNRMDLRKGFASKLAGC